MSEKGREEIGRDVALVASALGDDAGDAIVIGGAALALYPHAPGDEFRGTDDVDFVVRMDRNDEPFRRRLDQAGFFEKRDAKNRARRFLRTPYGETDVDVVFSNELTKLQATLVEDAFLRAVPQMVEGRPLPIRVAPPVNFIGLKLIAADDRGPTNDYKDIVDVADVLGNQPDVRVELEGAGAIQTLVRDLLVKHADLVIRLAPQAFHGDAESQRRSNEVAEWLESLGERGPLFAAMKSSIERRDRPRQRFPPIPAVLVPGARLRRDSGWAPSRPRGEAHG
jgi:hypothetical protein